MRTDTRIKNLLLLVQQQGTVWSLDVKLFEQQNDYTLLIGYNLDNVNNCEYFYNLSNYLTTYITTNWNKLDYTINPGDVEDETTYIFYKNEEPIKLLEII